MSKEIIRGYICSETAESIKNAIQTIIDNGLMYYTQGGKQKTVSLDICDDPVIYPEDGCCYEMCKEIEIIIKVKDGRKKRRGK